MKSYFSLYIDMDTPSGARGDEILHMLEAFRDLLTKEQALELASALGKVSDERYAAAYLQVRGSLEELQKMNKEQQMQLEQEGKSILKDATIAFEEATTIEDDALVSSLETELSTIE